MNTLPTPAALRKLRPSVYLKAAALVYDGGYAFACNAIKSAAKVPIVNGLGYRGSCPEAEAFVDALKPDTDSVGSPVRRDEAWYGSAYHDYSTGSFNAQNARVLGILLMRQLVLDARRRS